MSRNVAIITAASTEDVDIARQLSSMTADIVAHLTALKCKPRIEAFSSAEETAEPANKKIAPQRQFSSTKMQSKRPSKLSLKKPTATEKQHLLECLDGNVLTTLTDRIDTDHDYDVAPSDRVTSEHCYL